PSPRERETFRARATSPPRPRPCFLLGTPSSASRFLRSISKLRVSRACAAALAELSSSKAVMRSMASSSVLAGGSSDRLRRHRWISVRTSGTCSATMTQTLYCGTDTTQPTRILAGQLMAADDRRLRRPRPGTASAQFFAGRLSSEEAHEHDSSNDEYTGEDEGHRQAEHRPHEGSEHDRGDARGHAGGRRGPAESRTAQPGRVELGHVGVQGRDRDLDDEAESDDRRLRRPGELDLGGFDEHSGTDEQRSGQDRRGSEHGLAPEPFDDQSGDDHAEDADTGHRTGHEE